MKKTASILVVMVMSVIVLSGCNKKEVQEENLQEQNVMKPSDDMLTEKEKMMQEDVYSGSAMIALKDVTKEGGATGAAWLVVKDGKTHHRMTANNLPELTNGDFYEGWIVSSPVLPGGVVSTGVMNKQEDGTWLLEYSSDEEMPKHKTIVLTLEPDDGDPAPAAHVLEGKFE